MSGEMHAQGIARSFHRRLRGLLRGAVRATLLIGAAIQLCTGEHAYALQKPDNADISLLEAKEQFDACVSATHVALLERLQQREAKLKREYEAVPEGAARLTWATHIESVRADRNELVGRSVWPKSLQSELELKARLQAASKAVEQAYARTSRVALLAGDSTRDQRLTAGLEFFASMRGVSTWWAGDRTRTLIRIGERKEDWTSRGGVIQAPESRTALGSWAPFVIAGGLPPAFIVKSTFTRPKAQGELYVDIVSGDAPAYRVILPRELLARPDPKTGLPPRNTCLRLSFTGDRASIEIDGEDYWLHQTAGAEGEPVFSAISGIFIGSDDPSTSLSLVGDVQLRPLELPAAVFNAETGVASVANAASSCIGAVVPSAPCVKLRTSLRSAMEAYEASTAQLAATLSEKLDQRLPQDAPLDTLRKLRKVVDAQREQFESRAIVPSEIPFGDRDAINQQYREAREKGARAFAEALDRSATEGSPDCADGLQAARLEFDTTFHLAPWWKQEKVDRLVRVGTSGSTWGSIGTKWFRPRVQGASGTWEPFTVHGVVPLEFVLEAQLELASGAKNGLRLSLTDERGRWDMNIDRAQLECIAQTAATAGGDIVAVRITSTTSRVVVELNRERVWCTVITSKTEGDASTRLTSAVELTIQDVDAKSQFTVSGLRVKAIRTIAPTERPESALATIPSGASPVESARSNLVGPSSTLNAIRNGLDWLARHQRSDGSWSATSLKDLCAAETPCFDSKEEFHSLYDAGVTGLAALSFIRAGRTDAVVENALGWLVEHQAEDGRFTPERSYTYNEAIATAALAEGYRRLKRVDWKDAAQRGVTFIQRAQRPSPGPDDGLWGWRYASRMEIEAANGSAAELSDADTSVSTWCVMALKSAQLAGLTVEKESLDGALQFMKFVAADRGMVGYLDAKAAGATVTGKNDHFRYHPSVMSALDMCSRIFIAHDTDDPFLALAAKQIVQDLPLVSRDKLSIDYYYWYYGSSALCDFDGPASRSKNNKYWGPWSKALLDSLLQLQSTEARGCHRGGWITTDRWAYTAGPIYTTAIAVLTLELTVKLR